MLKGGKTYIMENDIAQKLHYTPVYEHFFHFEEKI